MTIGNKYIYLETVDSTNNYLKSLLKREKPVEGTVVIAKEQTAGRGQAGNSWHSEKDKNLTFSFVLYPDFIDPVNQFIISKAACLAISEMLDLYLENVKIKWPNDIYVNDNKIAGILIENTLTGKSISNSVIGIGLNVNQASFHESISNPTSINIETGTTFNTKELLEILIEKLNHWFKKLKEDKVNEIDTSYLEKLYRLNEWSHYQANDVVFEARIQGIDQFGRLILENKRKELLYFGFKEVLFL